MSKIIRTRKPSVLPYYAAALVFVVLCAVLPVYRLWALAAALATAAAGGSCVVTAGAADSAAGVMSAAGSAAQAVSIRAARAMAKAARYFIESISFVMFWP